MKKLIVILLLILISGCTTGQIISEQKEGPFKVTNVVDGDTLDINTTERVRLSGINTPETGECYYQEAKNKLIELTLNQDVYLERDISNTGNYGRLLRYIYIGTLNINKLLVEQGYARVYDKYQDDTKRYDELKLAESVAISLDLGVWQCEDRAEGCLYVGSKNSDKYHIPSCRWAKKIAQENFVCYKTQQEVAHLTQCGTCF